MSLIYPNRYPDRYDPQSTSYPQGKFRNRSSAEAHDGGYFEQDLMNDWAGFFGALLKNGGVVPNGQVDTALNSQYYNAILRVVGKNVVSEWGDSPDKVLSQEFLSKNLEDLNVISKTDFNSVLSSGGVGRYVDGGDIYIDNQSIYSIQNITNISFLKATKCVLPEGVFNMSNTLTVVKDLSNLTIQGAGFGITQVGSVLSISRGSFTTLNGFAQEEEFYFYRVTVDTSLELGKYYKVTCSDSKFNGIYEAISDSVLLVQSEYYETGLSLEITEVKTVLVYDTERLKGITAILADRDGILGGVSDICFVGKGRAIKSTTKGYNSYDAYGSGGSSGIVARDGGNLSLRNIYMTGWSANGLVSTRNSVVVGTGDIFVNSCGRNGVVCSSSSMELSRGVVCSGCLNDGYELQDNGFMYANGAIAFGNFRSGFSSTGNSYLNVSNGVTRNNRGNGATATASTILMKPSYVSGNGGIGILAQNSSFIDAIGSDVSYNNTGVSSTYHSTIQYGVCKTYENITFDYNVNNGGKIFATPVTVAGYSPKLNKNFNVVGSLGEVVSNTSHPPNVAIGVGSSPALTLTPSNQTWLGINGSSLPAHRLAVGGWIATDTGVRVKGDDDRYYNIAIVGGAIRVTVI